MPNAAQRPTHIFPREREKKKRNNKKEQKQNVVPITLEIKSLTQLLAQSQYPQRMHVDGVGKRALVRFCILRGATENIFQPIRQPLQGEVRCEMPSRPP